jgi:PAS domain S-box-containing protein
VKLEREAVDALARDILELIGRLRPVIQTSTGAWPRTRGQVAARLARDIAAAVRALDVAVEALYFQTESLEAAHLALEVERRAYREQFEQGPDGHLVTDPDGMIVRANARAGELFACSADHLVGEPLPALVADPDRASLEAAIEGFEMADWEAEWIGRAVRAYGPPFQLALTSAVVRHTDGSVYRVQWSVRDISRRPSPD